MSIAKDEAVSFISKLPDDYTLDEIMAELYFKQQVEQGLRDAEEGRVYTQDKVREMVWQWRKSSGRS